MMGNYILATCSTADISTKHMKEREIEYIKFSFFLDDKEFKDDLGQTIKSKDFYRQMSEGAQTKTSQPNVQQYKDFLTPFFNDGKDVILLNLSSGLSGAQASAKMAEKELTEKLDNDWISRAVDDAISKALTEMGLEGS